MHITATAAAAVAAIFYHHFRNSLTNGSAEPFSHCQLKRTNTYSHIHTHTLWHTLIDTRTEMTEMAAPFRIAYNISLKLHLKLLFHFPVAIYRFPCKQRVKRPSAPKKVVKLMIKKYLQAQVPLWGKTNMRFESESETETTFNIITL